MISLYNSSEFLNGTLRDIRPPQDFVDCLNLEDDSVGSESVDTVKCPNGTLLSIRPRGGFFDCSKLEDQTDGNPNKSITPEATKSGSSPLLIWNGKQFSLLLQFATIRYSVMFYN